MYVAQYKSLFSCFYSIPLIIESRPVLRGSTQKLTYKIFIIGLHYSICMLIVHYGTLLHCFSHIFCDIYIFHASNWLNLDELADMKFNVRKMYLMKENLFNFGIYINKEGVPQYRFIYLFIYLEGYPTILKINFL